MGRKSVAPDQKVLKKLAAPCGAPAGAGCGPLRMRGTVICAPGPVPKSAPHPVARPFVVWRRPWGNGLARCSRARGAKKHLSGAPREHLFKRQAVFALCSAYRDGPRAHARERNSDPRAKKLPQTQQKGFSGEGKMFPALGNRQKMVPPAAGQPTVDSNIVISSAS